MKRNTQGYHERERPITVTRGLPHYVIGKPYLRLLRLTREIDHMWHRNDARAMLVSQYERLYNRVYRPGRESEQV